MFVRRIPKPQCPINPIKRFLVELSFGHLKKYLRCAREDSRGGGGGTFLREANWDVPLNEFAF